MASATLGRWAVAAEGRGAMAGNEDRSPHRLDATREEQAARRQRRADALRENLARRKAQRRSREADESEVPGSDVPGR
jgi:hypothetical protein